MKNKWTFEMWIRLFFLIFISAGSLAGMIALIQFNAYTSEKNRMERVERKADAALYNSSRAWLHVTEVRNRLLWPAIATKAELDAMCNRQ